MSERPGRASGLLELIGGFLLEPAPEAPVVSATAAASDLGSERPAVAPGGGGWRLPVEPPPTGPGSVPPVPSGSGPVEPGPVEPAPAGAGSVPPAPSGRGRVEPPAVEPPAVEPLPFEPPAVEPAWQSPPLAECAPARIERAVPDAEPATHDPLADLEPIPTWAVALAPVPADGPFASSADVLDRRVSAGEPTAPREVSIAPAPHLALVAPPAVPAASHPPHPPESSSPLFGSGGRPRAVGGGIVARHAPVVAVVALAPRCGATTAARGLAAALARMDAGGAAIVIGEPPPRAIASSSARRLSRTLRPLVGPTHPVGRLCVATGDDLTAILDAVRDLAPVVVDAGPVAQAASAVARADAVVLVASGRTEPALAAVVARSLTRIGPEPWCIVSRGQAQPWSGREAIHLPSSRLGARSASRGTVPLGEMGRALADLAARCGATP